MEEAMVGIPAHNEENTIASVVLKAKEHVDNVLVVDDGSVDSTAMLAEEAGARVISHSSNTGYGAALRTIFQYAEEHDVSGLIILDADGQHPEEDITELLSRVVVGEADIAIGSRFLDDEHRKKVPHHRRFGIRVLTWLTPRGRSKKKVTDAQSGFRAYSKEAIRNINPKETGMGASAEILMEAREADLDIVEIPIEINYEGDTSHEGPFRHAIGVIASIIRYIETKHALLTFGVPGLVAFLCGIFFGLRTVEMFNETGAWPIGHVFLSGLLLIGGMGSGMTGLILHAVMNAQRRGFE